MWVAICSSCVVASFSDWLFMGVLFHHKYMSAPEIWRSPTGNNDRRLIIYSQLIGVLSCGAFAYLCMQAPRRPANFLHPWPGANSSTLMP